MKDDLGAELLASELDRLVAHLSQLGRPVVPLLRSGADAASINAALGKPVPPSVATWFGWCNGVASRSGQIQDDVNVIPGYNPLSIEEAVHVMGDYSGDPNLGQDWVPLLGGAGGDIYAAVWTPGGDASVAGVLVGEPTEIEFGTIEQMITVFNACYHQGAFFVDSQGRLAMDVQGYDQVYSRIVDL